MFLNPVMLAGVGGAVVPLALHFFSRARFKTVDWGGMMFLGQPGVRRLSGAALRQWTLLLLRMGIVALLATALARPVVAGWWGGTGGERRLLVLVIDTSASMGVEETAGRTRMDLARDAALRVLSRAAAGDSVVLTTTGDAAPPGPVEDARSAAARVAALAAGSGAADVAGALKTALDICDRADLRVSKEIYLVCDRQARSWDGVTEAFAAGFQGRRNAVRNLAHLYLLPVHGESAENVGIEGVDLVDAQVVRGEPTGVDVRVRNYGIRPRAGVPVTLSADGRVVYSTLVNLEPGAMETVHAAVTFPTPGPKVLTASVDAADMPADNRIDAGLDVRGPFRVLVLSGDKAPLLGLALAPFGGADGGANVCSVVVEPPDKPDLRLTGYDAVVLADVARLPDAVAGAVERFVYSGGGLIIAPGRSAQLADYRRQLYRNGAGVMPADLSPAGGQDGLPTSILGVTLEHPLFRFLRADESPVPAVTVSRFFRADVRDGDARVLASYATGDPFVVEGTFGRGRVLLVTTPLDATWSDVPMTGFFLPFVQSCVRYVTDAGAPVRVASVGEAVAVPLDRPTGPVHVTGPDGGSRDEAARVIDEGNRAELRFAATEAPGQYAVTYDSAGGRRETRFFVRPPAVESDLTPLVGETWDRVRRSVGLEELPADGGDQPGVFATAIGRIGSELWLPLVIGVLGLMLLETALGRTWSDGVRT